VTERCAVQPIGRRYSCVLALLLILCGPPVAALAGDGYPAGALTLHGEIFRGQVGGENPLASGRLRALAEASPSLSKALHHTYLRGVLLEEAGEAEAAREAHREYLGRDPGDGPLLAPYAHFSLAGLLERDGAVADAAVAFETAARLGGNQWPHRGEALLGAVRCAAASGKGDEALRLTRQLSGRKLRSLARRAELLASLCLIDTGRADEGRRRLQLLLSEDQGDDPALEAYRLLSDPGIATGSPPSGSAFADLREEAWYMGNAAYRNRRFEDAIRWLGQLLESDEGGNDSYSDKATFLIGRCHLLQGDFATARRWFLQAGEQFPRSLSGQDGRYFAAVCRLRVGDLQTTLEELEALASGETRKSVALKALTTAAWPLKASLDDTGLNRLTERVVELGGGRTLKAGLLMHLADVQRRRSDGNRAAVTLDRVQVLARRNDTLNAQAALWLARHHADAGQLPEALQQCLHLSRLDVPYLFRHQARELATRLTSESFPGPDQDEVLLRGARNLIDAGDHVVAREELEKFLLTCGGSPRRQVVLNLLQEQYRRELPHCIPYRVRPILPSQLEEAAGGGPAGVGLRRAAALLRIGRFGAAAAELEAAAGAAGGLDLHDRQFSIAVWAMLGGNYALSVRAAERLADMVPPSAVLEALPLPVRLLLHPGHHYAQVAGSAERHGLDPLLVLAVLREESRFGSGVRSGAAARGLMQILPGTAAAVAASHGIEGYSGAADLYRPEVSIAIGAAYLAALVERFQGNVPAALSAYNGGEANADRWLAAASDPGDPFDYIREVTFRESRNYVIKVLSSHRAYQSLGTKLVGHTTEIVASFIDWDLFAADLPAVR